jgi:hypothetical protein
LPKVLRKWDSRPCDAVCVIATFIMIYGSPVVQTAGLPAFIYVSILQNHQVLVSSIFNTYGEGIHNNERRIERFGILT